MAMKLYNEASVEAIADAIREKTGTTDTFVIAEMAEWVRNIDTGPDIVLAAGKLRIS